MSLTRARGRVSHRFVRDVSHRSVISSATGLRGPHELPAVGHAGDDVAVTHGDHLSNLGVLTDP